MTRRNNVVVKFPVERVRRKRRLGQTLKPFIRLWAAFLLLRLSGALTALARKMLPPR